MPNSYLIDHHIHQKISLHGSKRGSSSIDHNKFPEILISILVTIALIQPKLYLPVHIYVHHIRMYIISIFFIFIDNVMSLCTRFYNAVLDQQVVLTNEIQHLFFFFGFTRTTPIVLIFIFEKHLNN